MSVLKSSHRRRARWALVLTGLCIPALAGGEDSSPSVWERLRGLVSEEDTPMEETLESQKRLEADDRRLQEQLEQGRRLRAMHREAVFLSRLNVAWIQDQLEHWDCRMAEHKRQQARARIAELERFAERVEAMCAGLGARDGAQRQACQRQRRELKRTTAELEDLAGRYAQACPAEPEPAPSTPSDVRPRSRR